MCRNVAKARVGKREDLKEKGCEKENSSNLLDTRSTHGSVLHVSESGEVQNPERECENVAWKHRH